MQLDRLCKIMAQVDQLTTPAPSLINANWTMLRRDQRPLIKRFDIRTGYSTLVGPESIKVYAHDFGDGHRRTEERGDFNNFGVPFSWDAVVSRVYFTEYLNNPNKTVDGMEVAHISYSNYDSDYSAININMCSSKQFSSITDIVSKNIFCCDGPDCSTSCKFCYKPGGFDNVAVGCIEMDVRNPDIVHCVELLDMTTAQREDIPKIIQNELGYTPMFIQTTIPYALVGYSWVFWMIRESPLKKLIDDNYTEGMQSSANWATTYMREKVQSITNPDSTQKRIRV